MNLKPYSQLYLHLQDYCLRLGVDQLKLIMGARSVTGRIFTGKEQAQSHCPVGNPGIAVVDILGWIEENSYKTLEDK